MVSKFLLGNRFQGLIHFLNIFSLCNKLSQQFTSTVFAQFCYSFSGLLSLFTYIFLSIFLIIYKYYLLLQISCHYKYPFFFTSFLQGILDFYDKASCNHFLLKFSLNHYLLNCISQITKMYFFFLHCFIQTCFSYSAMKLTNGYWKSLNLILIN